MADTYICYNEHCTYNERYGGHCGKPSCHKEPRDFYKCTCRWDKPDGRNDVDETDTIDLVFTTEDAIAVLKSLLFRPHARGNGKSIMTTTIDMALCRAIIALEKELKQEKKDDCNTKL